MEAAMPLMYLPLIMYASWMEFLAQPFKAARKLEPRLQTCPVRKPTD
jgi:hypothetical protein